MFLKFLFVSLFLGFSSCDNSEIQRNFGYHKEYPQNPVPNSSEESRSEFQLSPSDLSNNEFPAPNSFQHRDEDCKPPPELIPPKNDIATSTLWEILENTEKDLQIHKGDAVLLLGNSGSGKSTVVLTISGDLKNLTVHQTESGSLIIVDAAQKIGITTSSRTLVPDLIHNPPNNLHFYDCPGFLDTRDYKADITANYLMKKATEGLTSVRPVFIVPEESVDIGGTKGDFGTLVTSAIRMIKDLDKLEAGIGMIVTKVKNYDARPKFRNDTIVMNGITKFLQLYREEEQNKLNQMRSRLNDESNNFVRRRNVYSPYKLPNSFEGKITNDEQEVIRRKIKFVDILLQPNKISFLRNPDECGSFDQSTWSQESRDGMTKLIRDDLKSVPVHQNDFGYALSADTTNKVGDLYKDLNSNVTNYMTKLVTNLRTSHLELTLAIKDFFQVKSWIYADYRNFTKTVEDLKSSKSPKKFGQKMYEVIVARGYDQKWGIDVILELEKVESYMDFFDIIATEGVTYDRKGAEWLLPLQNWVTEEISGRMEWYDFLKRLRDVFSYFRFQSTKQSYVPKNIREIKASLGKDEDIVSDKVIELYDQSVTGDPGAILTSEDTEILWEIVNEAFEVPKIECSSSKMTVKGSFVKASDFTQSDGSFVHCGESAPSQVVIYATRKVFFERSVNAQTSLDSNKELGIVSPEWEVIAQVTLDLSFKMGSGISRSSRQNRSLTSEEDPREMDYFDDMNKLSTKKDLPKTSLKNEIYDFHPLNGSKLIVSKFDSAITRVVVHTENIPEYIQKKCSNKPSPIDGRPGSNGSPGEHGGPGGNVIGLVGHIENADWLNVTVEGRPGGAGEDGVPGEEGQIGADFNYNEWGACDNSAPCDSECHRHPDMDIEICRKDGARFRAYFDLCSRIGDRIDCLTYGCMGGKGGRGGDGGAGGNGGIGQGIIVAADGSKVSIFSKRGPNGKNGTGAIGGKGGLRGNGSKAEISRKKWSDCLCSWKNSKNGVISIQESEDGENGVDGANRNNQETPGDPSFQLTQADLFLSYEEFALSRDSLYFPNHEFLDLIANTSQVAKSFSHIHFAQELLILERANLLLKNQKMTRDTMTLRMIPNYQSFISRLDGHVKNRNLDDPQRKFLSLLYSTAFNQKRTLLQVMGTPLIVDVAGYLETVDMRLEEYSKTETRFVVEAERVRYKGTFIQKMKDAMEFIIGTVDPAIEQTFVEMGDVTEELVDTIEKMITQGEEAVAAYKDAVKQTKKKMKLQFLFDFLKIGGAVIGLIGGPAGAAVGGIIGGAASIGEGVALGGGSQIRPPTPLDPKIKKYAEMMQAKSKATSQERQDELDTLIRESRMAAMDNKELLGNLTSTVDRLESDKKGLIEKGPSGTLKEFQDINKKVLESEQTLIEVLRERNEFIKKAQKGEAGTAQEQETAKVFGDKAISNLQKVEKAVKIVSTLGLKMYTNHKNNKKELERLMEMVEEAEEQVNDLKSYEEALDYLVKPFTESVINDLDDAQKQMDGQNAVFLRVQQWQVQKVLRQYNFFLQDFTGAFPDVANQYAFLVQDLQEAMTLMIDLYSFIDQYNEQMQFADYVANINSPRGFAAKFGPEESAIFDQIELALHASIILSEWDTCIQTFHQWVFPFSIEFQPSLQTSDIPDYLSPATPAEIFTEVLPSIRRRVTNLKIALKQYKSASFPIIDNQLYFTHFNSELASTVPFHVWRQELNSDKIRDLFSGKQVTLPVSPKFTYERDMSAVKFTIAEIEPKARNETVQEELQAILDKLKIHMSHSGVSQYLHEGTPFNMVGAKQEIHFNFERDSEGNRISPNQVYTKIKSGDVILSPYTLWTVQLFKAQPNIEFDFSELKKFIGLVNLELIGEGSFVRKSASPLVPLNPLQPLPLHYFRFKLSNLPPLGMNSRLQKLLLLS